MIGPAHWSHLPATLSVSANGRSCASFQAIYFKHNDAADLKRVLERVAADDRRLGRDVTKQRRFIVTEAIFKTDGVQPPNASFIQLASIALHTTNIHPIHHRGACLRVLCGKDPWRR